MIEIGDVIMSISNLQMTAALLGDAIDEDFMKQGAIRQFLRANHRFDADAIHVDEHIRSGIVQLKQNTLIMTTKIDIMWC
jgi:hypothetical protein